MENRTSPWNEDFDVSYTKGFWVDHPILTRVTFLPFMITLLLVGPIVILIRNARDNWDDMWVSMKTIWLISFNPWKSPKAGWHPKSKPRPWTWGRRGATLSRLIHVTLAWVIIAWVFWP